MLLSLLQDLHAASHCWSVTIIDGLAPNLLLLYLLLPSVVNVFHLAVDEVQNLRVGDLKDFIPEPF